MSDPVTNVEIEDVLSSIRKLVSEDARSGPSARRPERPGRLVLTPDLRVKDDKPAPAPATGPVLLTQPVVEPVRPRPEKAEDRPIEEIPREARLSDFGNVEKSFPDIDRFDSDDSSDPEEAETAAEESSEEPEQAERTDLSWLIEQEVAAALGLTKPGYDNSAEDSDPVEETSEVDFAQDDDDEAPSVDAVATDAEADAAELPESDEEASWHAFDAADTPEDETRIGPEDEADAPDDLLPEDWNEEPAEAAVAEPPEPDIPAPPQTLEDKVAALSRLVARDADEFEEERDRPDADDLAAASEPMTWSEEAPFVEVDEAEETVGSNVLHAENAWPQTQPQEPVAEEEPVMASPPEDVPMVAEDDADGSFEIDEAILRELVGDIVRQELQGALGERITRNVRKLVRREIHRMLISQEFD